MEPLPSPLPATTALADAADLLSLSGHGAVPVIDDTGEYVGVVTGQAVTRPWRTSRTPRLRQSDSSPCNPRTRHPGRTLRTGPTRPAVGHRNGDTRPRP
ncbi:CBS domain-containing protein [Streptomyces sp. NPDC001307]|uniref:CBS domain-containing protein n=1 Tax=Streptomyces sp. NPDC001307 TaxID=3364560 RepID=UPI0036AA03B7